jgi:hypothetical protein
MGGAVPAPPIDIPNEVPSTTSLGAV